MSITFTAGPEAALPAARRPRRGYRQALRSRRGMAGVAVILLVLAAGLLGPVLTGYGPLQQSSFTLAGPGTGGHLLGTDEVGRDILSRVLAGIRVDALLAAIGVPVAAVIGTALGLLSALSSAAGLTVQWLFSVLLGFPGVVMGIALSIAVAPGFKSVLLAVILVLVPGFGRQVRVTVTSEMAKDYVSAATVVGTSKRAIVASHILPNVMDTVVVRMALGIAATIQIEGALSVVGLGLQPPQASLGQMIASGSQYLTTSPLYSLAPVAVVLVLMIGSSMLASALNQAVLGR